MPDRLQTGVIGVGSMGQNHARVYQELPRAELVGVADADADRAAEVAEAYDTEAMPAEALLDAVDAVSIAVPTGFHYETARAAIERRVDVLVEKPFVDHVEDGQRLVALAADHDVTLQVGHIERFNPAVRTLADVLPELDVIAVDAARLGPPIDREMDVNPVLDLMIHDIDVVRSFVDAEASTVAATHAEEDPYATATIEFGNHVVGTFTASRVTQQKVRELTITGRDAQVTADYIDQTVEIHRQSVPEYVERDGDVRFRHRNIVERPTVENGEPLKAELESFIAAVADGTAPVVTGEDGLRALEIANRITEAATVDDDEEPTPAVVPS